MLDYEALMQLRRALAKNIGKVISTTCLQARLVLQRRICNTGNNSRHSWLGKFDKFVAFLYSATRCKSMPLQ
jgi:hypothetical protein